MRGFLHIRHICIAFFVKCLIFHAISLNLYIQMTCFDVKNVVFDFFHCFIALLSRKAGSKYQVGAKNKTNKQTKRFSEILRETIKNFTKKVIQTPVVGSPSNMRAE